MAQTYVVLTASFIAGRLVEAGETVRGDELNGKPGKNLEKIEDHAPPARASTPAAQAAPSAGPTPVAPTPRAPRERGGRAAAAPEAPPAPPAALAADTDTVAGEADGAPA